MAVYLLGVAISGLPAEPDCGVDDVAHHQNEDDEPDPKQDDEESRLGFGDGTQGVERRLWVGWGAAGEESGDNSRQGDSEQPRWSATAGQRLTENLASSICSTGRRSVARASPNQLKNLTEGQTSVKASGLDYSALTKTPQKSSNGAVDHDHQKQRRQVEHRVVEERPGPLDFRSPLEPPGQTDESNAQGQR